MNINQRSATVIDAVIKGSPEDVKTLVSNGANVNVRKYGMTALHFAAGENAPVETVKILLDAGCDVRDINDGGKTALDLAIEYGADDTVINVLREAVKSAQPEHTTDFTCLYEAARGGNANDVKALLNANIEHLTFSERANRVASRVNIYDDHGKTALMWAAGYNKDIEVFHALIEAGARVNATDECDKTALMYATRYNTNAAVTQVLVNAGALVNAKDDFGSTALTLAAQYNKNVAITQALIDAGANVNVIDNEGETALVLARKHNAPQEIIDALVAAGAK